MAKAVRTAAAPQPRRPQRPAIASQRSAGLIAYFQGVWDELRKVQWPTRDELLRMTGIVLATVVLFGVIIGAADYLLSLGVRQVYTSTSTSPTAAPATAPNVKPPHATPLP